MNASEIRSITRRLWFSGKISLLSAQRNPIQLTWSMCLCSWLQLSEYVDLRRTCSLTHVSADRGSHHSVSHCAQLLSLHSWKVEFYARPDLISNLELSLMTEPELSIWTRYGTFWLLCLSLGKWALRVAWCDTS